MLLQKLRLSSYVFMIERGRWIRRTPIDVEDRKCDTCISIEDEYHCMVLCPRFVNERRGCLPEVPENLVYTSFYVLLWQMTKLHK